MRPRTTILALTAAAALTLGLVPATGAVASLGFPALEAAAPEPVPETNPIGTMKWLPVVANERPTGFQNFRLVVLYDHSLDPDTGEPTDLQADGPWGMKVASNSVTDSTGLLPAIKLVGHSEHVSSLDDAGLPPELEAVDRAFMGLAGDVRDGDCANVADGDPSDLSYAYSTTFTLPGDVAAADCQVVKSQQTDPQTGEVISTTITEYVPGFWFDVNWPYETDLLGGGGDGHTLSELWYGAMPGFNDSDPTAFAEATETGLGETLRGPGDYIERHILSDSDPNPEFPCDGSGHTVPFTVPAVPKGAKGIQADLYPLGDWDLQISGDASGESGNSHVSESVRILKVSEGQAFDIEGCNFSGGPEAELIISWV